MREPESRFLDTPELRLHYLEWAQESDTVLFLHGGGLEAHAWDRTCAMLDQYHCVAPDLRGHGDTGLPPTEDDSLEAHVRDVRDLVDHLGARPVPVVGHSFGGFVAMAFAIRYPDDVASLVTVDATPFADGGRELARIKAFRSEQREFDSVDAAVAYTAKHYPERDRDSLRRSLERRLTETPDGRWTWKDYQRSTDYIERRQAEVRTLLPHVSSIRCPTLVMRGALSEAVAPGEAAKFVSLLPDARLAEIERAGHNIHRDNPEALAAAIHSFLPVSRSRSTAHRALPSPHGRSLRS